MASNDKKISTQSPAHVTAMGKVQTPYKKKSIILTAGIIILTAAIFLGYIVVHKNQHNQAMKLDTEATGLSVKGSYNDAANKYIEAYNKETSDSLKAGLAYKVGISYFDDYKVTEGKKWMQISADLYNKVGNKEAAVTATDTSSKLTALRDKNSAGTQLIEQNLKTRGNVQDSNL